MTPRHGSIENTASSSSIVASRSCRKGEDRFPISPLVHVRNLLPSNERCLQSHYLSRVYMLQYVCLNSYWLMNAGSKLDKVMSIYSTNPAYVLPCVANLTEEKFCVICLNFPVVYGYRKYVKQKLRTSRLCRNGLGH
jgi:hypothetical protein